MKKLNNIIFIEHFDNFSQGAIFILFLGGENVKIKVIKAFFDKEKDMIRRKVNDTLEVSDERGKYLISNGFAIKFEETETAKK